VPLVGLFSFEWRSKSYIIWGISGKSDIDEKSAYYPNRRYHLMQGPAGLAPSYLHPYGSHIIGGAFNYMIEKESLVKILGKILERFLLTGI
jgi:hypothetical protein